MWCHFQRNTVQKSKELNVAGGHPIHRAAWHFLTPSCLSSTISHLCSSECHSLSSFLFISPPNAPRLWLANVYLFLSSDPLRLLSVTDWDFLSPRSALATLGRSAGRRAEVLGHPCSPLRTVANCLLELVSHWLPFWINYNGSLLMNKTEKLQWIISDAAEEGKLHVCLMRLPLSKP